MSDSIKNGDYVLVYYSQVVYKGTVLNMPRGAGDLLQIATEYGTTIALNPYHHDFVHIEKAPDTEGTHE